MAASDNNTSLTFWSWTLILIIAVWAGTLWFVDPRGEFMVNDDWSFVKIMEALDRGTMIATGWGHGGPSAIVHVLWGKLFTAVSGYSVTNLRLSTVFMGFLGIIGILLLLKRNSVSPAVAFILMLIVSVNPLFLAQTFSFMTDITFTTLVIFSLLFIDSGISNENRSYLAIGLIFALLSILTRQIGIVIPAALIAASLIHPQAKKIGPLKIAVYICIIVAIPWISYEFFLARVGSTPLVQHQVIRNIFEVPLQKGFWGYLDYLIVLLGMAGMGYTFFFLVPLVTSDYKSLLQNRTLKFIFVLWTILCFSVEIALLLKIISFPVVFHRNIIFDYGIGPILLKDVYVLKIPRTVQLSPAQFFIFVYFGVASGFAMVWRIGQYIKRFGRTSGTCGSPPFISLLCLLAGISYWLIIGLTGFHDRYLIILIIFMGIWYSTTYLNIHEFTGTKLQIALGLIPVLALAVLSLIAMHDYMNTKRGIAEAQDFIVNELKSPPCSFDGGFEYNGYHCNSREHTQIPGFSWWWVTKEAYVITMGPLARYRTVHRIPIFRIMEKDAAIYILQSEQN